MEVGERGKKGAGDEYTRIQFSASLPDPDHIWQFFNKLIAVKETGGARITDFFSVTIATMNSPGNYFNEPFKWNNRNQLCRIDLPKTIERTQSRVQQPCKFIGTK